MDSFGSRLKTARLARGCTQEDLAEALGVTKSAVSAWENDRETPSFDKLMPLRTALDSSLDELVAAARATHRVGEPTLKWPELPPRDMPRTPEERAMLRLFRAMTDRQRRGLLAAFGPAERQAERPAAADAGRSQDLQPSELTMAFQLANEKIASDGLAPTAEEFGTLVLHLHDLLVGGLTHAELHDLRSGKLPDPSTGEGNATPSKPARQGERTAQSAVQHAAKAGRKS